MMTGELNTITMTPLAFRLLLSVLLFVTVSLCLTGMKLYSCSKELHMMHILNNKFLHRILSILSERREPLHYGGDKAPARRDMQSRHLMQKHEKMAQERTKYMQLEGNEDGLGEDLISGTPL